MPTYIKKKPFDSHYISKVGWVWSSGWLTVTDVSPTYAVVIFGVKVSCITSVDGIYTRVLDLIGQLRRDVIGRLVTIKLNLLLKWLLLKPFTVTLHCYTSTLFCTTDKRLALLKNQRNNLACILKLAGFIKDRWGFILASLLFFCSAIWLLTFSNWG